MLNEYTNEMKLSFPALSDNEALARVCVAAFAAQLNPTVSDLNDIKTAVSEAVTNSIIHGYENNKGEVNLYCMIKEREVTVIISDNGVGISDIEQAKEPLYTSKPEMERSGMGFTVMETFMDKVYIESKSGEGTKITLIKLI